MELSKEQLRLHPLKLLECLLSWSLLVSHVPKSMEQFKQKVVNHFQNVEHHHQRDCVKDDDRVVGRVTNGLYLRTEVFLVPGEGLAVELQKRLIVPVDECFQEIE